MARPAEPLTWVIGFMLRDTTSRYIVMLKKNATLQLADIFNTVDTYALLPIMRKLVV